MHPETPKAMLQFLCQSINVMPHASQQLEGNMTVLSRVQASVSPARPARDSSLCFVRTRGGPCSSSEFTEIIKYKILQERQRAISRAALHKEES